MRSQAIWHPTSLAVYIRQELLLTGTVNGGQLRCAASGPYAVYLNGTLVGRGLGGGMAAIAVWETFDLVALREGENMLLVFAVGAGEGDWFRAEGEIIGSDGTQRELNTGSPWQVQGADMWQPMGTGSQAYVAALESSGWTRGRFKEEEWQGAKVVEGPVPRAWESLPASEEEIWAQKVVAFGEVDSGGSVALLAQPAAMQSSKFVRREALLDSGKTQALVQAREPERAAYLVLDFGRIVSGSVKMRLRGLEGVVVDLGLSRESSEVESTLRYICGAGLREWVFPGLTACRYIAVRVSQCPEEMDFDSVSLIERRVEIETSGHFHTHGEDWARMWVTGARTLAACRREVYGVGAETFAWDKLYFLALNDFYMTGNSATARAVLASSGAPAGGEQACFYALFVEWVQRHNKGGEWMAEWSVDAMEALERAERDVGHEPAAALHALLAGAWRAVEALCRADGNGGRALECERAYHRARKGLQVVWNEERGLFAESAGSEEFNMRTNAFALYFDLAEARQQQRVAQSLSGGEFARAEDLWQAGFVAGALWQAGEGEWALAVVREKWEALLAREGVTWGEKTRQEAVQPGPEALLAAHVLGVECIAQGIVQIRPQLSGLERAEGVVPTLYGDIELAWGAYGGGFSLRVNLPHDGETHLSVPRRARRFPQISLNGETVWRNEKVHPNFLVHELISEEDRVVLVLRKAGEYEVKLD